MIRYYSRLLSLLATILLTINLAFAAGGQLSGQVKDESGQPVRGATVLLSTRNGNQLTATTNSDGNFAFHNLSAGEYYLKTEAPGFRAQVLELKLANNEDRQVELPLRVTGINDEVVVTAENSAQTVDELSKSLSVVDRSEIDQRDEYTLGETLRNQPGLRVRTFGGPGQLTSLRLRGLGNEDTAVLIDGLRLRDAGEFRGSSLSFNDALMTENIERVEILRGSGSSLYGTNAVGGVINIVPFTGVAGPSGEISFEGGSLGFLREAGRLSGSLRNQLSYSLAASRIDTNDGIDGQDIYRGTTVGTTLRYTPNSNISLTGLINYHRSFLQLNDSPFPIGPTGNEFGYAMGAGPIVGFVSDLNDPDASRTLRFLQLGVALRHRVNNIFSYYANFNFVRSNRHFIDGPASSPELVDLITAAQGFFIGLGSDSLFQARTYTFNGGASLRVGAHNLVSVGFEVEKERLNQTTDFFGKESFSQKSYGFYFQDQFRYFENRLQLSLGGRIQSFLLDTPSALANLSNDDLMRLKAIDVPRAYTGDGSISYSFFHTGTKLRAHVGNSFRAPSLSERFSAFDGSFMPLRIGNPFLRPERSISVDAGIDQSAFKNRVKFSLSYFYTRQQELIVGGFLPISASGAAFFEANAPGGLSRGFEAAVTANPARGLDVSLSYLYANSQFVYQGNRSDSSIISGSTRAFGIPRNTFNLIVNQRYRNFNINFDLSAVSEYDNPVFSPPEYFLGFASPIFRFKGHTKADLILSYTFRLSEKTSLELFGKGENIFDRHYFEDGFKTPGATGTSGLKFRF